MANKETIDKRAKLSAGFSYYLLTSKNADNAIENMVEGPDGDRPIIVAAPFESAVVTFHRMQQASHLGATVVTSVDDVGCVRFFSATSDSSDSKVPNTDLHGGMTTEEWFRVMEESTGSMAFTANGSEFTSVLNGIRALEFAEVGK